MKNLPLANTAPSAARRPNTLRLHGQTMPDDYAWLANGKDPAVRAYIADEAAYTESALAPLQALRRRLAAEMRGRLPESRRSVPLRRGRHLYYRRHSRGQAYCLHCRREEGGAEEVLLDENLLAEGCSYFELGIWELSPGGQLLLFGVDQTGSGSYSLAVKDLSAGILLERLDVCAGGSAAWADDGIFFYSALGPEGRVSRLCRHRLGCEASLDALIYEEQDAAFHLAVGRSESGAYLLLALSSRSSEEVRVLETAKPGGGFRIVQQRRPQLLYSISHQGDHFFVLTNEGGAVDFQIMQTPVERSTRQHWRTVVPPRPEVMIEDMRAFANHLVIFERRAGLAGISVLESSSGRLHRLWLGSQAHALHRHENPAYHGHVLRFGLSTLTSPESVFEYDLQTRRRTLKQRRKILGGFSPQRYVSLRTFAVSADGAKVPISLAYRKDRFSRDGSNPLLLYGYGAYGLNVETSFAARRLSLIDRGWTFAIAHVRGGGELGKQWHLQGRGLHKQNSFRDFIACAEHLIKRGYSSPQRLTAVGSSAGGLLVAAAVNQRPDLFCAAAVQQPFVDPIRTLLDSSHPTSVADWEEFGDPHWRQDFCALRAYSPYDNVAGREYPALLVTASLNDPLIPYWEPLKWVAKLRHCNAGCRPLLLHLNFDSGHSGPSGLQRNLEETAFLYAFLISQAEQGNLESEVPVEHSGQACFGENPT